LIQATTSSARQHVLAVAGVEVLQRQVAVAARDSSTTCAPSAISSGIESPIGEPLATLPPSVPELRTGRPAKRLAKVLSCGRSATSAAKASVSVTAAPMAMWLS
jgi:hypothetical protein